MNINEKDSLFYKLNKEKKKILKLNSLDEAKENIFDLIDNSNEVDIQDKIKDLFDQCSSFDELNDIFTDLKRIEKVYIDINEGTKKVKTLLNKYTNSCIIITSEDELDDYIKTANLNKEIAIDTETTGLNVYQDKLVGVCLFTPSKQEAYIPINHVDFISQKRLDGQLSESTVSSILSKLNEDVEIQMHNADFDIRVLRRIGVSLTCGWDTLIAGHLLNENEEHGLKTLHQKYVLKDKEDEFSFGKLFSTKIMTFADIPIEIAAIYAAHDAKITKELRDFQYSIFFRPNRPDLQEVYNLYKTIELPCIDAICNMEDIGFALDMEYQEKLHNKYHELLNNEKEKLYAELKKYEDDIKAWRLTDDANYKEPKKDKEGNLKLDKKGNPEYARSKSEQLPEGDITEINLSSPTQLGIILYDIMKLKHTSKKDGPRSTSEEALKSINTDFTNMILAYRSFSKMVDAFIDSLPQHLESDNRIHCSLNQYGAKTGRLSCSNPNLQQIPSSNQEIRKLFIAPTINREVEAVDDSYTFKNTEEIEISPDNWKFVKDLVIGDIIEQESEKLEIIDIQKNGTNIILKIKEMV